MEKGKMKLSRKYYERLENVFSIEYKDTAGTSNARVHRHLIVLGSVLLLKQ